LLAWLIPSYLFCWWQDLVITQFFLLTVQNSSLSKINGLTVIINCLLVQFPNRKLKKQTRERILIPSVEANLLCGGHCNLPQIVIFKLDKHTLNSCANGMWSQPLYFKSNKTLKWWHFFLCYICVLLHSWNEIPCKTPQKLTSFIRQINTQFSKFHFVFPFFFPI